MFFVIDGPERIIEIALFLDFCSKIGGAAKIRDIPKLCDFLGQNWFRFFGRHRRCRFCF